MVCPPYLPFSLPSPLSPFPLILLPSLSHPHPPLFLPFPSFSSLSHLPLSLAPPSPHPLLSPFSRRFNNIVSLYTGSVTQLLSNSLIILLVSITPGADGKENSKWEGRREMRDGRGGEGEGGGWMMMFREVKSSS